MKRAWKKLRYRLEHIGLLIAASLVPLLPRPVLVGLAKIFGAVAAVVDRYGRRIALANLDCAFGEKYSASEKRRILRESYQHFAQTMLDLMWSPRLTPENFSRYIEFESFPRSIRITTGLLFVITTAISNGSVWAADFAVARARSSPRNLRMSFSTRFSGVGGNSPAMFLVPARGEFYDFSKPCVVAAISQCWLI